VRSEPDNKSFVTDVTFRFVDNYFFALTTEIEEKVDARSIDSNKRF